MEGAAETIAVIKAVAEETIAVTVVADAVAKVANSIAIDRGSMGNGGHSRGVVDSGSGNSGGTGVGGNGWSSGVGGDSSSLRDCGISWGDRVIGDGRGSCVGGGNLRHGRSSCVSSHSWSRRVCGDGRDSVGDRGNSWSVSGVSRVAKIEASVAMVITNTVSAVATKSVSGKSQEYTCTDLEKKSCYC
ncbi:hypothetical protein V5799_003888 [Amblyomma americanum]|uniref:Uncharacterized protein n=1 Tax=Amblyomma americanum TaxID=6943 RepID=A0AAQ4D7N7_AMBAM